MVLAVGACWVEVGAVVVLADSELKVVLVFEVED